MAKILIATLTILALIAAGTYVVQGSQRPSQPPQIKIDDYLLRSKFFGVQLDGPMNEPRIPGELAYSRLKTTGKAVSLTFAKGQPGHGLRGNYQMSIGSDRITGEWNITGSLVHLWIDFRNGKKVDHNIEPMEILFRAPRTVLDPFAIVIQDPQGPKNRIFKGVILMSVDDPKYFSNDLNSTYRWGTSIIANE